MKRLTFKGLEIMIMEMKTMKIMQSIQKMRDLEMIMKETSQAKIHYQMKVQKIRITMLEEISTLNHLVKTTKSIISLTKFLQVHIQCQTIEFQNR